MTHPDDIAEELLRAAPRLYETVLAETPERAAELGCRLGDQVEVLREQVFEPAAMGAQGFLSAAEARDDALRAGIKEPVLMRKGQYYAWCSSRPHAEWLMLNDRGIHEVRA